MSYGLDNMLVSNALLALKTQCRRLRCREESRRLWEAIGSSDVSV